MKMKFKRIYERNGFIVLKVKHYKKRKNGSLSSSGYQYRIIQISKDTKNKVIIGLKEIIKIIENENNTTTLI